jgi:seryl-tRNA synthetase
MKDLKEQIKSLKEELKGLKEDLSNVGGNLDQLDSFIKEFKKELVKDGIIKSANEDISMEIKSNEIIINGKKLPDDLMQKYRELYKSYLGKYPKNGVKIIE